MHGSRTCCDLVRVLDVSRIAGGFGVGKELTLGVIFTVDLILSVDAAIDISTGVHIKLEDGVGINIPMFAKNVSNIMMKNLMDGMAGVLAFAAIGYGIAFGGSELLGQTLGGVEAGQEAFGIGGPVDGAVLLQTSVRRNRRVEAGYRAPGHLQKQP